MSCFFCFGQFPKQKTITDKNCPPLSTISIKVNELKISDEEITEYLKSKYPKIFFKTGIQLNLILLPNTLPCCRSIVIFDSTRITQNETSELLKHVINFPKYNKIKIDKPRHLQLLIGCDNNYRPTGVFMFNDATK